MERTNQRPRLTAGERIVWLEWMNKDWVVVPPTIEPETFGVEHEQAPTVLWIPTAHAMYGDELPPFVLRLLADDSIAMLVYTSFEKFVAGCGSKQPYIALRTESIQTVQYALEADVLLWDVILDPVLRQDGEVDADGISLDEDESDDDDFEEES